MNRPFFSPESACTVSRTRREFLRDAAGLALGSAVMQASPFARAESVRKKRKIVVVTFGGGARDQETFAPEGQENIPHMLSEMAPQSSFFTHVTNQGILGHYAATASLATGVYETLNNFASVAPEHPTVFEYFRKELKRPSSDAWVVAPSNGFHRIGESEVRGFGPGQGARVILPKRLLGLASSGGNGFQHHRTGDAASRTTWMMVLGAGVRQGVVYDTPVESIDLVPSIGAMAGFSPSRSSGKIIRELV